MSTKILIIDDNEAILDATQRLLEYLGFEVNTSQDPDYINGLDNELPDLILLDILLVNADGREVCKNIKLNKNTKHIPVVMLSAQSEEEVRAAAASCGAQGHILKPYKIDTMISVIEKCLKYQKLDDMNMMKKTE